MAKHSSLHNNHASENVKTDASRS